ncbi:type II secretion system F family protein [Amycolatopsis benzoatilytica]|uniref:type II secretion system F family protein n=1 Tax=Amycolatopsis benzoatilytica TaxID=346045 RepID=UPI00037E2926|nr:type II secretion system F family protein [Amycolatopsis benzoatilytica]
MTVSLLLGVGAGAGLALVLAWAAQAAPRRAWPARNTEPARFARSASAVADPPTATLRFGALASVLRRTGLPGASVRRDLRVIGREPDAHLAAKALLATAGLLAPWALQAGLAVLGASPDLAIPAAGTAGLAAAGFVGPDLAVRARATRVRREFRAALSAFLDLVSITLAGGAGVESALVAAAAAGHGPSFDRIRHALREAPTARTTPWRMLHRLGEELDVGELKELAASISLAGTEGARIRASLAAKADALRAHQISDAEAEAHAATERMALPVTLLFLGFLAFIAYPAVTQVLNGL